MARAQYRYRSVQWRNIFPTNRQLSEALETDFMKGGLQRRPPKGRWQAGNECKINGHRLDLTYQILFVTQRTWVYHTRSTMLMNKCTFTPLRNLLLNKRQTTCIIVRLLYTSVPPVKE